MAYHSWPTTPTTVDSMGTFESTAMLHEDDLRCAYSSKKCTNVRTTKKGGGLHRFCEFHRRRANQNQWRVDDKRRGIRAQRRQLLKRARSLTLPDPVDLLDTGATLTAEDIQLLQALLLDGNGRGGRKARATSASISMHQPGHERQDLVGSSIDSHVCIV